MKVGRRGVAQVEFVVGMPLVMVMFGLVVLGATLAMRAVSRSSSTGEGAATPRTAAVAVATSESGETTATVPVPVPAAAESCDIARTSLQAPRRFRVLGDGQAVTRVQPIARLGKASGK
jgi:hypothetical protein